MHAPRPVAVFQAHGTADPLVPYGGNPILGFPSTAETIDGWRARDACAQTEGEIVYEDDATTCERWGSCEGGADVELCTVEGGLHDWFGGGTAWTEDGPPEGFVATLAIVDFLFAHPM